QPLHFQMQIRLDRPLRSTFSSLQVAQWSGGISAPSRPASAAARLPYPDDRWGVPHGLYALFEQLGHVSNIPFLARTHKGAALFIWAGAKRGAAPTRLHASAFAGSTSARGVSDGYRCDP